MRRFIATLSILFMVTSFHSRQANAVLGVPTGNVPFIAAGAVMLTVATVMGPALPFICASTNEGFGAIFPILMTVEPVLLGMFVAGIVLLPNDSSPYEFSRNISLEQGQQIGMTVEEVAAFNQRRLDFNVMIQDVYQDFEIRSSHLNANHAEIVARELWNSQAELYSLSSIEKSSLSKVNAAILRNWYFSRQHRAIGV